MTLESVSRSAVIGLSMLTSMAIIGVVISAVYQDAGYGIDSGEPPLIRVPQLPWKLPPDARLDGAAGEPSGLDRLLPEDEEKPGAVAADEKLDPPPADPAPVVAIEPLPPASPAPSEPSPEPIVLRAPIAPAAPAAAIEPLPAVPPTPGGRSPELAVLAVPTEPAAAPAVEYRIQLLAGSDRAAVERAWNGLQGRLGARLADLPVHIEQAALAAGTVYRLQIGGFVARATAEAKCAELKREQASCFVLRVRPQT